MIEFENIDKQERFSFSVNGNKEEYILTIEALLDAIANRDKDFLGQDHYYLCELIKSMLPSPKQIMSLEEVAELERIKGLNKQSIMKITEE